MFCKGTTSKKTLKCWKRNVFVFKTKNQITPGFSRTLVNCLIGVKLPRGRSQYIFPLGGTFALASYPFWISQSYGAVKRHWAKNSNWNERFAAPEPKTLFKCPNCPIDITRNCNIALENSDLRFDSLIYHPTRHMSFTFYLHSRPITH